MKMILTGLSKFKAIILIFFCLYLFFVFDINFHGPDEPIYFAYTSSIIDDGDLNTLNQVYTGHPISYVSKTFNLIDFHGHGGVLVWAPFYAYGKALHAIGEKLNFSVLTKDDLNSVTKCLLSFASMLCGFLTILFSYLLAKLLFSEKVAILSVLAIFLGTPFFYYMLFQGGNANIVAALFSVLLIWFLVQGINMKKGYWFAYGLFFSICVTVKTELWFELVFIIPLFIALVIIKKVRLSGSLYFILGFLSVLVLRAVNAYIKYGSFHMEEIFYLAANLYRSIHYFNGLLSSYRGILYASPILYTCFLGYLFVVINIFRKAKNKERLKEDILLLVLGLAALVKLFLLGRLFSPGGDTLSGRTMISEFAIFALLFGRALTIKNKLIVYAIYAVSALFLIWNLLIISEHLAGLDWLYITGAPNIILRLKNIRFILDYLQPYNNLSIKIKYCVIPFLITAAASVHLVRSVKKDSVNFWSARDKRMIKPFTLFYWFVVYLFLAYALVTVINVSNNKTNAQKLRKELPFKNIKVLDILPLKMTKVEDEEVLWNLFDLMRYYGLRGEKGKLNDLKQQRERLFGDQECVFSFFPIPPKAYSPADFYNNRRYQRAIDCYQEIIKSTPKDTDALLALGDIYVIMEEYAKAKEYFKGVLDINPGSLNALSRLADVYYQTGDFDSAIEYYHRYLELSPTGAGVYLSLGGIYQIQGNYSKAIDYYQKYLWLKPRDFDGYRCLVKIYTAKNDRASVLKQIKRIKELGMDKLAEELEQELEKNMKN